MCIVSPQEDAAEPEDGPAAPIMLIPLMPSKPRSVRSNNAQCHIIEGIEHMLRPLTLSSHCPSQDLKESIDPDITEALTDPSHVLEADVPSSGQKEGSSEEDLDMLCDGDMTSQQIKQAVGNAIMKLGLSYLEKLKPGPEQLNVIISPLSLSVALSQLMLGKCEITNIWVSVWFTIIYRYVSAGIKAGQVP